MVEGKGARETREEKKKVEEYWRSSSCRAIEQHLPGSHDCLAIAVPTCFEHATQFVCVSLFYRPRRAILLLSSLNIVQRVSWHGLSWPFDDRVLLYRGFLPANTVGSGFSELVFYREIG